MKALLLLLALAPAAAFAQAEDAAHRMDRIETATLNSRSANGYPVERDASKRSPAIARYDRAQAEYQRRLEAWRRRVAACEAGHDDACD